MFRLITLTANLIGLRLGALDHPKELVVVIRRDLVDGA